MTGNIKKNDHWTQLRKMPVTFAVDPVAKNIKHHTRTQNPVYKDGHASSIPKYERIAGRDGLNGFFHSVHMAYSHHYPLAIKPDDIWLLFVSGFSIHINLDSEKFRSKFVSHQGKKTLRVRDDSLVWKSPDNNWINVFSRMNDLIKEDIGAELHSKLVPRFTTTGPNEIMAFNIAMMSICKDYYDYRVMTLCGIPEITIEGTKEDWVSIYNGLDYFSSSWELDGWLTNMKMVVRHFIDVFNGKIDIKFWRTIYKEIDGSGGPYFDGWIGLLFPYLFNSNEYYVNKNAWNTNCSIPNGSITTGDVPTMMCKVDWIWEYYETEYNMHLWTGFIAASQSKDGVIHSEIGWGIGEGHTTH